MTKKKTKTSVKENPSDEMLQGFKNYLKIENPEWFKMINFSCNTVIDNYCKKYNVLLNKPEYNELIKALAERDSNFK